MRRVLRRLFIAIALVATLGLLVAGGGAMWIGWKLRASLPVLDGELPLAGLVAPVTIERDSAGLPTISGRDPLDVARGLGFVHGQDRFFQMDLLRRRAAGRLAELLGAAALPLDRAAAVHRFAARTTAALRDATPETLALLQSYADGVNAGLAALDAPPPEYVALRVEPAPWSPADSRLVVLAMYLDLQGGRWARERDLGLMRDVLPPALVRFLVPPGTPWDAPLVGEPHATPPFPEADIFDLRRSIRREPHLLPPREEPLSGGSNAWAVGGAARGGGAALFAYDPHLGLALPNTWYRTVLVFLDGLEEPRSVVGVTLPGAPGIISGSNGHVAWGFTNAYGDFADLRVVEWIGADATRYRTADGDRESEKFEEWIPVRGAKDESLTVVETVWGPLIDEDHRGRPLALRWIAHDPFAADVELWRLNWADDVAGAIAIVTRAGLPAQNLIAADLEGSVGWTIAGTIPGRPGAPPDAPVGPDATDADWTTALDPALAPRIVDPPQGRVWSANHRMLPADAAPALGDGGFALGARAASIRDGLDAIETFDEASMLALQLDDRSPLLGRWRARLLQLLDADAIATDPRRAELRQSVEHEGTDVPRASVDSVAYRLIRGFRTFAARRIFAALTAACVDADERFDYFDVTRQWEGPLWKLLEEQPLHLLDPAFESWDDWLLAAVDDLLDHFGDDQPLDRRTWGERNIVRVRHPISLAAPRLARWLDAPPRELPGDVYMPRVQAPGFGASFRLVVEPGAEERGLFHMPGGPSGHPLSPWYLAGHDAWATGRATPLMPGPTIYRLELRPASAP